MDLWGWNNNRGNWFPAFTINHHHQFRFTVSWRYATQTRQLIQWKLWHGDKINMVNWDLIKQEIIEFTLKSLKCPHLPIGTDTTWLEEGGKSRKQFE